MAPKRPAGGTGVVPPASAFPAMPARLTVALVRGVRGLKGHVRVELLTDRPEERFALGARLLVEGTPQVLTVAGSAAVADGPGWWLRFREIPSREAADALRDRYLEIEPPAEAREPGKGSWAQTEIKVYPETPEPGSLSTYAINDGSSRKTMTVPETGA